MKLGMHTLLTASILLFNSYLFAQHPSKPSAILSCASTRAHEAEMSKNSTYVQSQQAFESYYQKRVQALENAAEKMNMSYTIPVVVHIVHACAEYGTINNPSDQQVTDAITELNERFAHTHSGAQSYTNPNYGLSMDIQFCLASLDPSGAYTTGIVRHPDQVNHVGNYQMLRQAYAANYRWDRTRYYNIFIATDLTDASGVYLGGSSSDFIICDAPSFNGGLLAHETGHYLSLRHTFGGCGNNNCLADGDFVCDTPPKNNYGVNGTCTIPGNNCTTDDDDPSTYNPYRSTSLGGMGDQVDMLANYMDYTESCWDAFTLGQKTRMHTNIEANRMTLVNNSNTACASISPPSVDVRVLNVQTNLSDCAGAFSPSVSFQNNGTSNLTSVTISVSNAGQSQSTTWTGNLATGISANVSLPSINLVTGINTITATASAANGSSDGFSNNDEACTTVAYPSPTGLALPFSDNFSTCALNPFYALSNGDDVQWTLTNYSSPAGLTDCQDCFARVLGFATPAEQAQICLPKFDFTGAAGPRLQFLLGHIPRYTFITNRINVTVSTDCGAASTIWTGSALDLASNIPPSYSPNQSYLYPTCAEMKPFDIDLSAYADETNVEICIEADGRWYSPLILDEVRVEDNATKQIAIKTMLYGPYNSSTGRMNADIRQLIDFPLTEPYTNLGHQFVGTGGGETIAFEVLYPNDNNAIVDWVVLEVRSGTNPETIVSSRAALLQSDGDVVDLDGVSSVTMRGVATGNYYVSVRHRNHLGCMSNLVYIE